MIASFAHSGGAHDARTILTPSGDLGQIAARGERIEPRPDGFGETSPRIRPAHLQWSDVMKRDIDLARQLLLDIEARGADCSVSVLRTPTEHDAEERVRYHLRLLVDAGYLKEVDRTAGGVPCLRLTDAGHELIELARSEERWREAKRACHERTGGVAIAVIRGILIQWALAPQRRRVQRRYRPTTDAALFSRPARPYAAQPPEAPVEFVDYSYADSSYADSYAHDELAEEFGPDEQVRYVRVRPSQRNGWRPRGRGLIGELASEAVFEASLPEYLI